MCFCRSASVIRTRIVQSRLSNGIDVVSLMASAVVAFGTGSCLDGLRLFMGFEDGILFKACLQPSRRRARTQTRATNPVWVSGTHSLFLPTIRPSCSPCSTLLA